MGERLTIVPSIRDEAFAFITRRHRHHPPPESYLFALAVANEAGEVVGVLTAGRPSAQSLDADGWTFEVTRTCTDGFPNANSCLYGAAWRVGKNQGYRRAVTYTQDGETGASLRAAGWRLVAALRPRKGWDTPSRRRDNGRHPTGVKRYRWEITADAPPWAKRPRVPLDKAAAGPSLLDLIDEESA